MANDGTSKVDAGGRTASVPAPGEILKQGLGALIDSPGYHLHAFSKGVVGELSKVEEEVLELEDALLQDSSIMALVELSDLVGAVNAFIARHHPQLAEFPPLAIIVDKDDSPSALSDIKAAVLALGQGEMDETTLRRKVGHLFGLVDDFTRCEFPGLGLEDLEKMSAITQRAFKNRRRS